MKKVKGFTLLELIIVLAIFSAISVGALAMIRPVMQLFNKTAQFEKANADADNVRRYVEDNLKYADRLLNCVGYDDFSQITKDSYDYITYDQLADTKVLTPMTNQPILQYFKDHYYPFLDAGTDYSDINVYVMEIDNGDMLTSDSMGMVKIYRADLNSLTLTLDSETNADYYEKYSYNLNFGNIYDATQGDYENYYSGINQPMREMYIDIFEKRTEADGSGNWFDDIRLDSSTSKDITSALYLMNLDENTDVKIGTNLSGDYQYNTNVSRYEDIRKPTPIANPKYYFIYTVPEIISP